MSSCTKWRAQASSPEPALFRIREGYRARWNDLTFSVESGSSEWTLEVEDTERHQMLYRAQRMGVRAAQAAAAEFAIFRVLGADSRLTPAQLAGELNWQHYW